MGLLYMSAVVLMCAQVGSSLRLDCRRDARITASMRLECRQPLRCRRYLSRREAGPLRFWKGLRLPLGLGERGPLNLRGWLLPP